MSLSGEGAVAIWHDIAAEARDAFYAWHGEEHMPERVGIPGFLRGRRYVAVRPGVEFFNLYEAASPQVLDGTDYLARLNNPTPWTKATVPHFSNVARSICKVAASYGHGSGGLIATWRYSVSEDDAAEHRRAMCERILPALAGRPGVAGAHLLIADISASAVKTAEQRVRSEANVIPGWVVLLEGWGDEDVFADLCEEALSDKVLSGAGAAGPAENGIFRLQATRLKTAWTAG